MTLNLTRLSAGAPIVQPSLGPTAYFMRWWVDACSAIEGAVNSVAAFEATIAQALGIANAATSAATAAGSTAATAAIQSAGLIATTTLNESYVTGFSITATDGGASATITVPNHTRVYGDGSSVAVTGAALTGLAYSTSYYVYYDQISKAGGAVGYQAATTIAVAGFSAANPGRHFVGAVVTPAAAGAAIKGIGALPPGVSLPSGFVYS